MDRENLQTFLTTAEGDLASVRNRLIIVAQTADASELVGLRRNLARLETSAIANEMTAVAQLCSTAGASLDNLSTMKIVSPEAVYAVLDVVGQIEAAIWRVPMQSDEFLTDIAEFIDASFEEFMPRKAGIAEPAWEAEEFDIDEETLDIFRCEAEELLASITNNLRTLATAPGDQNALWDIRRNAHTFKGAAGIVGLKKASAIAHRMEDLLDRVVETRSEAAPQVIDLLDTWAIRLSSIVAEKDFGQNLDYLEKQYSDVMSSLSVGADGETPASGDGLPHSAAPPRADTIKSTTTPIVRVSLERLDDLIKMSRSLLINRSAIAERFGVFKGGTGFDVEAFAKLEVLLDAQRYLTDEIQAQLLQIRMVKFGTLETRLSRAVNVTCQDEGKRAVVEIVNGDVEIDTQIIDALIEPLLHLLKNAVVHGIELPETRRLIGKPEKGNISIRLEADMDSIIMSVTDDGGGISVPKLKERAIANKIIDEEAGAAMTDHDAMQLIFDRGLTTAEKIDLNAGRGVGMSIVKESVESRGGTVLIESESQRGTSFTILMPLASTRHEQTVTSSLRTAEQTADSPPPVVLVVDDSASIRRQTSSLIESAGLRAITANNGAEALELLLSGDWEPDLILSDVEMPQIDGWDFLEYVKSDKNFGHIPVVMVTSLNAEAHRLRAINLGAADYLIKPLDQKNLARVLDNVGYPVARRCAKQH